MFKMPSSSENAFRRIIFDPMSKSRIALKWIALEVLVVIMILLTSCEKRKARQDIIGDWTVTGYTGALADSCSGNTVYADIDNEILGNIRIDERYMRREYVLRPDSLDCLPYAKADDLVRWKVTDHEEITSAAHTYTLDLAGQTWNLNFGNEGVGEYAAGQELIYLETQSADGDAFAIELTRDEE